MSKIPRHKHFKAGPVVSSIECPPKDHIGMVSALSVSQLGVVIWKKSFWGSSKEKPDSSG